MKKVEEELVNDLESSLSGALKPVSPPVDVMQRLKERMGSLEPHRIAKRISNWELTIITIGSVMSVAMVILTIARALFYFFQRKGKSAA
jgi:hypothetical protein